MQIRGYGAELKFANIMFASLFRNMRITRSEDDENKTVRTIDVPVVIADRSRIFKNLENYLAQSALTLPLITVQRTGIAIVPSRITNLHNEIKQQETVGRINYNLYTPTPLDISYSVVMVSRWMNDIDLMLGQIIPFFNTDVYVSHRHPKYRNVKYSSQVIMGTDINIESSTDTSKDSDEIHTATLTFTYKTHIFGGTDQLDLAVINPYIAPITKISPEIHMVSSLEPNYGDIDRNSTGLFGIQDLGEVKEQTIDNYMNRLDNGEEIHPEYEQIDWILDYNRNEETGEWEVPYDPNMPYGYEPENGDGLTYVTHKHRLYDQEAEITPDHMKQAIQSQNFVSQWSMPYRPIETRPWNDTNSISEITDDELKKGNPMGSDDYTEF